MTMQYDNLEDKLSQLVEYTKDSGKIDLSLYTEYDVKRGLRDSTGKGVLTGLTEISDVIGFDIDERTGEKVPTDGRLYFQGYNVADLIKGMEGRRFGFEEITYLLLFGSLPTEPQLNDFNEILSIYRELPDTFVRDVVMKATSKNMMNTLQRCVLTLYSYDEKPDDISIPNVLRQALSLIAKMPLIAVYGYHAYRHYHENQNLIIRNPKPELSMAENILQMLHPDGEYTALEAKVLDVALILHADHGGGNNSTFTTHVVSSSGTDTYSAVAASLSSLKGPRHGGANLKGRLEPVVPVTEGEDQGDRCHQRFRQRQGDLSENLELGCSVDLCRLNDGFRNVGLEERFTDNNVERRNTKRKDQRPDTVFQVEELQKE